MYVEIERRFRVLTTIFIIEKWADKEEEKENENDISTIKTTSTSTNLPISSPTYLTVPETSVSPMTAPTTPGSHTWANGRAHGWNRREMMMIRIMMMMNNVIRLARPQQRRPNCANLDSGPPSLPCNGLLHWGMWNFDRLNYVQLEPGDNTTVWKYTSSYATNRVHRGPLYLSLMTQNKLKSNSDSEGYWLTSNTSFHDIKILEIYAYYIFVSNGMLVLTLTFDTIIMNLGSSE